MGTLPLIRRMGEEEENEREVEEDELTPNDSDDNDQVRDDFTILWFLECLNIANWFRFFIPYNYYEKTFLQLFIYFIPDNNLNTKIKCLILTCFNSTIQTQ